MVFCMCEVMFEKSLVIVFGFFVSVLVNFFLLKFSMLYMLVEMLMEEGEMLFMGCCMVLVRVVCSLCIVLLLVNMLSVVFCF